MVAIRLRILIGGMAMAFGLAACSPAARNGGAPPPTTLETTRPSGGSAPAGPDGTAVPGAVSVAPCLDHPDSCSLREVAAARGVLVGTAVSPGPLQRDGAYGDLVRREFNSVTSETQAKWETVEPRRGVTHYESMDALVAFAQAGAQQVRGHTLLWDQPGTGGTPAWVTAITDRDRLRAAVTAHISSEVGRYAGRVARWDVVNEPLEKLGATLTHNHFWRVLGPGYVGEAFSAARAADPKAELYLNENVFEHLPAKAVALYQLVADLKASGVPIDGVGLQAHFVSGRVPEPGVIAALVRRLRGLGLRVSVTELDLPRTQSLSVQASGYARVVRECLEAGCDEITVWGADDAVTWLDRFLGRSHTDPLLFDRERRAKPAYRAFRTALAQTRERGQ